ncbi:unnamed protein product [Symbiodinium pilosum]|uniref:Uncharacterized protein n=1 Tax=Symbiodinium pilosum TaxID=2952 RepID=A0A812QBB1_SYMPI|nr:unnamed protein product [Symbiodinium pilosum]
MSFAHVTLPRTNAPAATCSIGAPPRFLRAASPHARDATSDIAAAATTPTALCRGAQRSWRPMAPGRRERVGEAANPGPPAADSRGAPSALEVQRQCAAEALARAGLPPFPPLPPEAVSPCGTISDTASQATDLAYLTPRAAGGDLTPLAECGAHIARCPNTRRGVKHPRARSRWQRGPPAEGPLPPTNSWIYMPLLLDGAGLLCPAAAAGWRACAPYAVPWPALVTALPTSALRLPEDPIASVRSAGDAEAEPGADGYLTAATQSAFLQAYGGVGVAAEAANARAPRAPTAPDGASGSVAAGEAPEPGVDRSRVTRHVTGNLPWADVAELRRPVPTLQDVPPFLRAGVRRALVFALRAIRDADAAENAHVTPARAWLLLERVDRYERGEWLALLAAAQGARSTASRAEEDADAALRQRREAACRLVRKGEVSRARHLLTSGTLAPGDEATWPCKTPRPSAHARAGPSTARAIAQTLREARRGAASGLSGARAEHFKLLQSDADGLELLMHAASVLAQAGGPLVVAAALALARMTALQKPDGGVRGIATGDVSPWPIDKQLAPANASPVVGVWAYARMVASDAKAVLRRGQRSACSCPGYGACIRARAAGPDLEAKRGGSVNCLQLEVSAVFVRGRRNQCQPGLISGYAKAHDAAMDTFPRLHRWSP